MERCGKLEAISLSSPLVAGQDGKAVEVGKEFDYCARRELVGLLTLWPMFIGL
jgi:hypothetical protein